MVKMKSLTLKQLAEGRRKAISNAEALVKEAALLHANRHWARTIFLSQIAGEEIGKSIILGSAYVDVFVDAKDYDWDKLWRRFRSHREKLKNITFLEDMLLSDTDPDLKTYTQALLEQVEGLEVMKQKALYSDMTNAHFHAPSEMFDESMATNALKWAEGRVALAKKFEETLMTAVPHLTVEAVQQFREQFGLTDLFKRLRRKPHSKTPRRAAT